MPTDAEISAFLATLLPLDSATRQAKISAWLAAYPAAADALADTCKRLADYHNQRDRVIAAGYADILDDIAAVTHNPLHGALGRLAHVNHAVFAQGDYKQALTWLTELEALYTLPTHEVLWARMQRIHIWCLFKVGQPAEAIARAARARVILTTANELKALCGLLGNLGEIYYHLCEEQLALETYVAAEAVARALNDMEELGKILNNRQRALQNLGRLTEAEQVGQEAYTMLSAAGLHAEASRAQWNNGYTQVLMGRYHAALRLFNEAYSALSAGGWEFDLLSLELDESDCQIRLRRFETAQGLCERARARAQRLQANAEDLEAFIPFRLLWNEGLAETGLAIRDPNASNLSQARQRLMEAYTYATTLSLPYWVARVNDDRARLALAEGRFTKVRALALAGERLTEARALAEGHFTEARALALENAALYQARALALEEHESLLIASSAAFELQDYAQAAALLERATPLHTQLALARLGYTFHWLHGALAEQAGNPSGALADYEAAVADLERQRGWLMIEHRSDFLEDKHTLYEDCVRLYLASGDTVRGLEYAERAKSRTLFELLAHKIELRITPQNPAEESLLADLRARQARLNALYQENDALDPDEDRTRTRRDKHTTAIADLEREVARLWEQLLTRHTARAHQAVAWVPHAEPILPHLEPGTVLLEYFAIGNRWVAFTLSQTGIRAQVLDITISETVKLLDHFELNRDALITLPSAYAREYSGAATQKTLARLHAGLLAPLIADLAPETPLIIVPHRKLHYLPFHALYDGTQYLIQRHPVRYLPSASLLRFCQPAHPPRPAHPGPALTFGYSLAGRLPHTLAEAERVATLTGGTAYLEGAASLATLHALAPHARLLHLATHGFLNARNPLFSSLALADGMLTTLDIFNLPLSAELVTLSACHSGSAKLGSGDELLGLARAFLYAGAAALVLSLWAVEDRASLKFMEAFYTALTHGQSKPDALRAAQCQFIATGASEHGHPFYWAPFMLIGNPQAIF